MEISVAMTNTDVESLNHGEHGEVRDCDGGLIDLVLTAATTVHAQLGPGLLESVYEHALLLELAVVGVQARRQVEIPVLYRGQNLGIGFRADINDSLLLEIKAVEQLNPVHLAQVITYLKVLGFKRGYILNFNRRLMKDGIKRVSI
jgi:GxxExxY protein